MLNLPTSMISWNWTCWWQGVSDDCHKKSGGYRKLSSPVSLFWDGASSLILSASEDLDIAGDLNWESHSQEKVRLVMMGAEISVFNRGAI